MKAQRLGGCALLHNSAEGEITIEREPLFRLSSARLARHDLERIGLTLLPGESAVVLQSSVKKLPDRVSILRSGSGSPAIFIFRSQSAAPSAPVCGIQSLIADELRQSAVDLAREHRIRKGKPRHSVLAALGDAERVLDRVSGDLVESLEMEQPLSNSGEWLYDNNHVILAHIAEVRRHLPRDPQDILPILDSDESEFRVYRIALTLVRSSDSLLTPGVISAYLDGYQSVTPLTIAELWIFPLMIRLALIQELARLGDRVSCEQHQRDVAYFWADRLARASRQKPEHLDRMIALLDADPAMVEPQFLARLTEQLRDEEDILAVLRAQLDKRQQPLAELIREDHQQQARDRVSVANAIGSLRTLADLYYPAIFEKASVVHALLEHDPAAIYPCSDFTTRDRMRRAVEEVARNSRLNESEVAQLAIDLAKRESLAAAIEKNAGYYLIAEGRTQLEEAAGFRAPWAERIRKIPLEHPTGFYLGSIVFLSLLFVVLAALAAYSSGVHSILWLACLSILAAFPSTEIAIQIVNAVVVTLLSPRVLPKMNFEEGIPQDFSTLVVVPMMLLTPDAIRNEVDKLEVRYLANREPNISFALLSDFTDAPEQEMPEDEELLTVAIEAMEDLSNRHRDVRFVLFHRTRRWSEVERKWIGWERKRGKLEELNRYLNGEGTVYDKFVCAGTEPENIRFVITLDADTQLPANAARRLIETLAHPLNQISLSEDGRERRRGYSIIQPRVSITLPGTTATRFTRLFTESSGTDPYSHAVSDAYQDLFGEGIYHGKAIYDVRAFHRILSGRFPEGLLLSHDLIEGAHVGVGLASDIELFENFPYDYHSHSRRQHRWIRGDWQILSWIFPRVPAAGGGTVPNLLPAIERWKIFDNLRRSLTPPASIVLLLASWLTLSAPGVWSSFVGLCLIFSSLASLLNRFSLWQQGIYRPSRGITTEITRLVTAISLLPHQAWIAVDAIARSFYRMWVSHEHLLEWETAESTHLSRAKHFHMVFVQTVIVAGATIFLLSVLSGLGLFWEPFPFALLWITAPQVLRWLNAAAIRPNEEPMAESDRRYLRGAARDTWRYFDDFVSGQSNWLPPDNFQEALRVEVAERTSPTNIGMWLNALLAAKDFGYVTLDQFATRCAATLETLGKLERFEGHFLNWYHTRTLTPLNPRYLSTVDSGNLLASLWVMGVACEEMLNRPVLGEEALRGLVDTSAAVWRVEPSGSPQSIPLSTLIRLLRAKGESANIAERIRLAAAPAEQLAGALRWSLVENDERSYWFSKLQLQIEAWAQLTGRYLRWLEVLAAPPLEFVTALGKEAVTARAQILRLSPSLVDIANGPGEELHMLFGLLNGPTVLSGPHKAWLEEIRSEYERSKSLAVEQIAVIQSLGDRMRALADEHHFGFLYDSSRNLFHIGTSVTEAPLHAAHYDLLASESRLTSLVAIAKGDVPIEHWQWLGRPYASYSSGQLLYSWSGTMFEYLMPNLFSHAYENSLLAQACQVAVTRQIEYGEESGVPWGVSESAYSALDAWQTYQYSAFGVPGLGLKRGLGSDLVVSPYSTMLALSTERSRALENLRRLEDEGLRGRMGFYESIDYTRNRSREGAPGVIIYAFMAHHQGMSLLAMDNVLHGDVMRQRFHSDPRIKAVESLLFEGVPKLSALPKAVRDEDLIRVRPDHPDAEPTDRVLTEATAAPRVHILGNGSYSVALTNSGGGYSRWKGIDLTRWRADTTRDHWGSFCYLRDLRSGRTWSTAFHPTGKQSGEFAVSFAPDRVEWVRRASGIDCRTEITVSPEADIEIRRLTLTNHTLRSRQVELTTFAEICIAPHEADRAHPAFNRLFIQTEAVADLQAVFASRRPRGPSDTPIWFAESVFGDGDGDWEFETDRSLFLGRGGSAANPAGLNEPLSGTAGTVLDSMFGLRRRIVIDPRSHAQVTFVRAAADSRDEIVRLIAKYRSAEACHRSFELAWTHVQLEFRHLGIDAEMAHRFQELASHILYSTQQLRAPVERLRMNRLPQSRMWAHGISGDLPIVAVAISDLLGISLVKEALLAHTFWALRGLKVDLLILNQESPAYDRPLHDQLLRLANAHSLHTGVDQPGGIFLRNWHQIPEDELNLLLASASIYLSPPRTLAQHLGRSSQIQIDATPLVPAREPTIWQSPPLPFLELPYFNGLGGFSADGKQYSIYLGPNQWTPLPWVNVFANPNFGAMMSECGPGFAWRGNSQANRLLPWHNDPVVNPSGDALYIRDEETGEVWTPTASPIREQEAYRANHGAGYTIFEHNSHGIEQLVTAFVPSTGGSADPLRIQMLRLKNSTSRNRKLSVTAYAEWVLGSDREETQHFVVTNWNAEHSCLLTRNSHRTDYGKHLAFAASFPPATSFTADRTAFLGRNGSPQAPAALRYKRLSGRSGVTLDPCAALQSTIDLAPGAETVLLFLLGEAEDEQEALRLTAHYRQIQAVESAFAETCKWWDGLLGTLQVQTPILSVNLLVNRWLLYQTLSCRIWGRSAFYQSGGAFGFRDQLQDVLALITAAPHMTREHILLAASRQFPEGDVQHWWHPPAGGGVRTHCSDDLLWLPFAVCHYVRATGDLEILNERVPFLNGPALKEDEGDAYYVPAVSAEEATIFEHCRRSLERSRKRGIHGLPLMGAGDWNDGMNLVGKEGKGESVWLAWFLIDTLQKFAALCVQLGEMDLGKEYRAEAEQLKDAVEFNAWDGEWYLRAFHDDGTPLGSHENPEAKIDSIAQSWGAISEAALPSRAASAMAAVEKYLVREKERIVLLFDPPFDVSEPHPGYIQGYPPGVRENGGQYTHGALWVAQAYARMGEAEKAVRTLQLLNPIERTRTPEQVAQYQGEPYVMPADVYNLEGKQGRCGWSWYTGSSGWMYRIWVEEVLGFQLRGDALELRPRIPESWPECSLTYRYRSSVYEITLVNAVGEPGATQLELDGAIIPGNRVPLTDDGRTHTVRLRISRTRLLPDREAPVRTDFVTPERF